MAPGSSGEMHLVAALLRRRGRVLLCHRSPHRRWYPDTWDLPGGHVEQGEQPRQALVRELREELGVEVASPGEPFAEIQGEDFRLDVWTVDEWAGDVCNRAPQEHDDLAWIDLAAARRLQLADPRLLQLVESALTAGRG